MSWPEVLGRWSFDPSIVIGLILAAVLYWRGQHNAMHVLDSRRTAARRWNALAFYAGLGFVVLALESPIDALSADLFTFHMVQHLILIMIAAPLLVLGDPSVTLLRGIPLSLRRRSLGFLADRSSIRWAGHQLSWLVTPKSIFALFLLDLYFWHWTWLFNLTLQNNVVHLLEHLCFLGTALLFWSQVIDQRALHPRLSYAQRALYTVITAACSNILAMYFVFTPRPVYSAYAHPLNRLYGMTPLGDQQIAGAIMWVPVLFIFGGAFAVCLYKALAESEREEIPAPVGGTPYSMLFMSGEHGVADSAR